MKNNKKIKDKVGWTIVGSIFTLLILKMFNVF